MSRPWGLRGDIQGLGVCGTVEKKQEAGRVGGAFRKKGATRGLPRGSPILRSDRWDVESSGGRNFAHWWEPRREQPMHAKLAASSTTWTAGLAPLCHIFVAQISPFSVDSGAFSIVGRIRDESAVGSQGEIYRGWGVRNGREKAGSWTGRRSISAKRGATRGLPRGYARFNLLCSSSGATGGTSNLPGGVTLRTGGATPRAAYAREARRELHDVDSWACPVVPHFVAQISPFSVDSGAFSIVGRIRDESAVGSQGEIYRGWGVRNGREKAGSWTGRRSISQKGVQHEDFPGDMRALTFYALAAERQPRREQPMHAKLAASSTTWTAGLAPLCHISWPKFRRFRWIPARFRSLAAFVMSRPWGLRGRYTGVGVCGTVEKKQEAGRVGGAFRKKGCNTRTSQGVTHPSTTLAQARLTSEYARFNLLCSSSGATGGTSNLPGGVTLRTGGATPRAAYAREARRELHDVDSWACPVVPHFVAQISPFSVDSGAFSIVGRIRDESAVGSQGEIYRGWGVRNGREKAGSWTGRRSISQKGVQHEDFPGDMRALTFYALAAERQPRREQPMHAKLAASSTTWTAGLAPLCHISWPKFRRFRWIPARFRSLAAFVMSRPWGLRGRYTGVGVCGTVEKKQEAGRVGGAFRKKGCNTRTSQGVTHPSTTLAQARLTSEYARFNLLCSSSGATGGTSNLPGGVTLRTGGATPRAAYAREARRELHDVDSWACPVVPHFVAQISPFSVDSGAFSIVGRIRDESAVGSQGEIYRGWGVRNGREKAGSWTGRRSISQKGVQHEDFPGDMRALTFYALAAERQPRREQPMHAKLAASSTTWTAGLAPLCHISWPKFRRFRWIPARFRSLAAFVMSRPWGLRGRYTGVGVCGTVEKKQEAGRVGGAFRKKGCNTRTSQGVTHPSTTLAQARLTSEYARFNLLCSSSGATGGTSNLPGGVTLRTGGATPRAAYAREARRELHDVDSWACPVVPHFVAQISPFSVDSGAFSIVGRIRDESAVGSQGEIYRGWGVRNGREKAGSWTGRRSISQKGVQHEDFPGDMRALTFYALAAERQPRREQPMHAKLAASSTTWTAGLAPLCHISWPKFRRFRWIPARFRSLAAFVMSRPWGLRGRYTGVGVCGTVEKKQEAGRVGGAFRKKGCNTRTSQGVTHPSTTLAQARLTSEYARFNLLCSSSGATGGTSNLPGGVTLRTGGATPRAAYAREARRELHDVDSWACPVVPHFVAQISPFSVDSGAFSIVGRIRDESAVGSQGEIYRGWGVRNGREKAGSWTGRRSISQKGVQHEDFPGDMRALTFYALAAERQPRREQPMHAKLAASSTTWTAGLAPLCHISWPKFRRFRWIPARFRSLAAFVMSRPWGLRGRYTGVGVCGTVEKKQEAGRVGGAFRKKGCNTRTSQGVTHPSTTLAQARLTSEYARFNLLCSSSGATGGTSNLPGGVTLRTGGATPRAAYAREARRELHDVDSWACPVVPHFVAQISPFSVDSGAFSIVGRIRDESAVGSQGEIYRGWGVRNGREKAGSWTGRRSISQKGVQHEDFPGDMRALTFYALAAERQPRREQPMHAKLAASSTTWTAGLAPLCHISWPKFRRFRWIPARFRSLAAFVMSRPWGLRGRYTGVGVCGTVEKKQEAGRVGGAFRKKGCNTRTSQGVTHPSTTLAQARLTSEYARFNLLCSSSGATGGTSNLPGGVTLRTGGATPRAAYAREARRELHDVDSWACPVVPHFVAQISPFSVDSGAFSIVGRIRDESAVGSQGEIYRGWGVRNGREKAGSWTGRRSISQKGVQHEDFPGDMRALTFYALAAERQPRREQPMHAKLAASSTTWTAGLAPLCHISWPKFRRFRWIPARFRSLAAFVMSRPWGLRGRYTGVGVCGTVEKKQEAGRVGGAFRKKGCNTRTSQGVTHPSTTLAQARLTSEYARFNLLCSSSGATGGTSNLPGGVTLRTGGATPRAAYAREARRELHDVDSWACPVVPHFVAQISPFSVDSGAFSIVGRIRDESAVGSQGEIYRGWGVRNGREKAGSWTGRRSISQKGVQHEDFPGDMRALTFYALAAERQPRREQPMHAKLAASSTTWTAGLAPLCHISWPKFRRFRWIPARFRSLAAFVMSRPWGLRGRYTGVGVCGTVEKKQEAGRVGGAFRKKGCNTRTSQGVTHPSTTLAQARLTSEYARFNLLCSSSGATGGTSNLPGGVTLRTGGATPRAAYAREARRELHDVDSWACPVVPHFVAQISPFSVDSGAFSIVGRIRDESAVGSQGEIYRGWGVRNGREKAGSWTGRRSISQKGVQHEDFPGDMRALTFYALAAERQPRREQPMHAKLAASSTTWTAGLAPLCHISWPKFRRFRWIPARFRSLAAFVMSRPWGLRGRYTGVGVCGTVEKKQEAGRVGGAFRKKGCNTRTSQGVTHPSTTLAQARLTSEYARFNLLCSSSGATGGTSNLPGGVTLRTGGATPRAAYAREARRELHDVDNWACPVVPHFVAQISPFSVDSGAFSIVGRIRDESAVGSQGEIYRGWGVRNGREKAGSWTGRRSISQKGVQHEDFPGDMRALTFYALAAERQPRREQPMHAKLAASSTTWTTGLAPLCHISWPKFRRFRWIPARFRSLAAFVMSRPWGLRGRYTGVGVCGTVEKKQEAGRVGGAFRKKGCNTRTSQGVTHPSTTLAQARLTSEYARFNLLCSSSGATGGTSNLPGGVTLRTGGATPRAAYAREARRELHDVDNWACPVVPHFVAQISPFSVDSGAFSIVGRIRDESAVGSQGEIYRGWGVRNGREKAGSWTGREEHFAKRGATRGLPRGSPILVLLSPKHA
ncbi:UNVERIFIED_CONTAM: hypothetical protein Sindi_2920800 [Sesamum indicum]